MITDIPEEVKANKDIIAYIHRSNELEDINPIVSYYCKLYVLEHILNHKLHQQSKAIEGFTITLLDATETIKNSDDESIKKVLMDKTLSISVMLNFSLKIFNESLDELTRYSGDRYQKMKLISKFKACLNFLKLLEIFKNDDIDYAKLTNGKLHDFEGFSKVNKDRMKLLKYNLSKLIKDEIKGDTDELDQELEKLQEQQGAPEEEPEEQEEEPKLPETPKFIDEADQEVKLPETPKFIDEADQDEVKLPDAPKFIDEPSKDSPDSPKDTDEFKLPEAPKFIDENTNGGDDEVKLPGAPHFDPDEENDDIKLPGAPKFLPDDDLSHINKNSSIQVFAPGEGKETKDIPEKPTKSRTASTTHVSTPVTKENINVILDKQELITKIQKHCKFAASALNYEDLDTAEHELMESLQMLKLLKQQEQ